MAQAGYTPIRLYYSTTASAVPTAANLAAGELGLNIADMKLYCENSSGVVTLLASSSGASGDVVGPASATDNAVVRFDGTTGKLVQNSGVLIADDGTTVISVNSATDALRITQTGAGNALVVEDSSNPDSTPFVVQADGKTLVGSATSYTTKYLGSGFAPGFQVYAVSGTGGFYRYSADSDPSCFVFSKSRDATLGSQTVVNSSDNLGYLGFTGSDGTAFITAASIIAAVDGTPGTNDMPGRLVFSTTADGASSPTERFRITNAGAWGLSGANYGTSGQVLTSNGSGSAPTWQTAGGGGISTSQAYFFSSFN